MLVCCALGQFKWFKEENQIKDISTIPNLNKSKEAIINEESDIQLLNHMNYRLA